MSIKAPTPKPNKPKTESKLSPVLEGDGNEFIEEQAELPSVQEQRHQAMITDQHSVGKKVGIDRCTHYRGEGASPGIWGTTLPCYIVLVQA